MTKIDFKQYDVTWLINDRCIMQMVMVSKFSCYYFLAFVYNHIQTEPDEGGHDRTTSQQDFDPASNWQMRNDIVLVYEMHMNYCL